MCVCVCVCLCVNFRAECMGLLILVISSEVMSIFSYIYSPMLCSKNIKAKQIASKEPIFRRYFSEPSFLYFHLLSKCKFFGFLLLLLL